MIRVVLAALALAATLPGTQLRADLWREYKLHTEILKRIGMIKN